MPATETDVRDHRATASLLGLSTADAYGNRFFNPEVWGEIAMPGMLLQAPHYPNGHIQAFLDADIVPEGQWSWTDDTEMACGIVSELRRHGHIDQDSLARTWATHYQLPRDYGTSAIEILSAIRRGEDWRRLTHEVFGGAGSLGNGSAMRIAPLGAWFADDMNLMAEQARRCSEITHHHPEGIAGGIATAAAAAIAARGEITDPRRFLDEVITHTPEGTVQDGLKRTAEVGVTADATEIALAVGNGRNILTTDTVPLCVWIAATHRLDYPAAVRTTVSLGGDIDTTAAIVGGIVAAGDPDIGIPDAWAAARESLPDWL